MTDECSNLEIGSRLSDRYRIESVLGRGGMGSVYLGSVESLGNKKVAIKEMFVPPNTGRTQAQAIQQFKKEATFLAHLDHPNVVKVTDFFADGDKHYLVMDYVEGQTLQQILEQNQRAFDWPEIRDIADSLMDVLSYLHSQSPPILFRDLKPANIMVEPNGGIKLIDFGIARTATPGMETSTFLKGTGTNGFSPIEQYGVGEGTDQRSDIYAFGATLYYLLSGRLPTEAIARVSGTKALVPLHKLNSQISVGMSRVIHKCMAVKQKERYTNIALVREMLFQAAPRSTVAASEKFEIPGLQESSPQKDNSSVWAAALATITMAAAVMMIIVFHQVSKLAEQQELSSTPVEPAAGVEVVEKSWQARPRYPSTSAPVTRTKVVYSQPKLKEIKPQNPPQQSVKIRLQPRTAVIENEKPKKRVVKTSLGDGPSYPRAAPSPTEQPSVTSEPNPSRRLPGFRTNSRPRNRHPNSGRRLNS